MTTQFLTISVMGLALVAGGSSGAQAQGWVNPVTSYANDDYRASYADAQRAAHDNGYRDGLKRGEQAARDGRPLDVERERDYRSADGGFNRSHGDRNRYRDTYRGGFAQGYRDGYSQRGARNTAPPNGRDDGWNHGRGYGGNASFGARQNGVSDGYKKGLDDLNDRKYPDVNRQKWYRNGDHDYDSRYGSKETYRVEYRRGFEDGYNRAYRERGRY